MFAVTLMTVVLKTATVTSLMLGTPADRIGQGLRASTAYPMDNLSSGQIPLPHNPEPEQARVQQLSSSQMRKQMRAGDRAVPPASLAGCPSVPGFTAVSFTSGFAGSLAGWQYATQTAATSRTATVCLSAAVSRVGFPGDLSRDDRSGSDCQSPDRDSDKQIAIRKANPAEIATKK
jgi:hypothetical protein